MQAGGKPAPGGVRVGGLEPPTSWLRTRHSGQLSYTLWCGRRESNPLPRRWQRRVLPIVNYYHVEEGGGVEPLPRKGYAGFRDRLRTIPPHLPWYPDRESNPVHEGENLAF